MITPFSLILFGLIVYKIVIRDTIKNKYIYFLVMTIAIEILFMQGFVINYGQSEFRYGTFCSFWMLFYSLYFLYHHGFSIKKDSVIWGFGFFFIVILSTLMEVISPYEGVILDSYSSWDDYIIGADTKGPPVLHFGAIVRIVPCILAFIFNLFVIKTYFKKSDLLTVVHKVNIILQFNIFYVAIEAVLKNVLHSSITMDLNGIVFGVGSSTFQEIQDRAFAALQGVTREPSHLAFTLFWTLVFIILEKKILQKIAFSRFDIFKILSVVILMVLSSSFSVIIYFICIILFCITYYAMAKGISVKKLLISGVIVFIISLLSVEFFMSGEDNYFIRKMNQAWLVFSLLVSNQWNFLGDFGQASSALARFTSIYETSLVIADRPILGLGIGLVSAHSGLITALGTVGFIGMYFWWKMCVSAYRYSIISVVCLLIFSNIVTGFDFRGVDSIFYALNTIVVIECFRLNNID